MQEGFIKFYGMLKAGIVLFNSKNAERRKFRGIFDFILEGAMR